MKYLFVFATLCLCSGAVPKEKKEIFAVLDETNLKYDEIAVDNFEERHLADSESENEADNLTFELSTIDSSSLTPPPTSETTKPPPPTTTSPIPSTTSPPPPTTTSPTPSTTSPPPPTTPSPTPSTTSPPPPTTPSPTSSTTNPPPPTPSTTNPPPTTTPKPGGASAMNITSFSTLGLLFILQLAFKYIY